MLARRILAIACLAAIPAEAQDSTPWLGENVESIIKEVAPIPRFPPGLLGAWSPRFVLAPGMSLPQGDPGHSRIGDEAAGACLSRTACDL
jgi:hypothetical protein